ncbi:MAG: DUF3783 domain-containing protein [Oscillospiraceae bacterium]|nr:DUF3783 domain-containing protein [Ruminiclostridium sp.]MBQ8781322.1 DUF3783 domain-containing protein [Oscillospiraceae bacterium]
MKSRIINPVPEAVIIYKVGENAASVRKIADRLNVKVVEAADDKAGEAVGFLADFGGFSSNGSSEEADEGCMIFSSMSGKRLDVFLSELRKAEISIPYKAVVTATNQSWSLKRLISELIREREQLGG